MENLDDIFAAALKAHLGQWGAQSRLAKETGISRQVVNDLVNKRKYGSEAMRRRIAEALGYPGPKYEEFLEVGRRALGQSRPIGGPNTNNEQVSEETDWRQKYYKLLEKQNDLRERLDAAQQKNSRLKDKLRQARKLIVLLKKASPPQNPAILETQKPSPQGVEKD